VTIVYNPQVWVRIGRIEYEGSPTMKRVAIVASLAASLGICAYYLQGPSLAQEPIESPNGGQAEVPKRVEKSDAEWQKVLTRDQFLVTRKKMTEPAGTGKYARFHGKGIFACVCCGNELFDARTKFESGTGWPSFYKPIANGRIATAEDYSEPAEVRVEVMCSICDAHLGHVFSDGPRPTGLRFCINSASLKLVKPPASAPKAKAKAPAKADSTKPKAGDQDEPADMTEHHVRPSRFSVRGARL